MENKNILTKILAIAGTVLVWLPIAAPLLFSMVFFARAQIFRFDWLMPAELFLFALAGGGLLLSAALRAHSRTRLVAWGIGIAILMFFGSQSIAVVTGLASGEREPTGWIWITVLAALAIYTLAVILVGSGGILLLRDLFRKRLPGA